MARIRLFILLAGFFLMASAVWADDVGYIDCNSHPDAAQIFSKARQTPDVVGTIACGERFTVLVYGFVFSRVQTHDGKVGYVYSNLISIDRGGAASQPAVPNAPAAVPVRPAVANASVNAPAYAQPTSAEQAASMPVTTSLPPAKPAAAQSGPLFPTPPVPAVTASDMASASAQRAPAAAAPPQPAPAAVNAGASASKPVPGVTIQASAPSTSQSAAASPAPAVPAPAPQPAAASPADSQPGAAQVPAQSAAPAQPGPLFPTPPPQPTPPPADSAPAAAGPQPEPAPAAQPQPDAEPPAAAPVRSTSVRSTWENPLPGARRTSLLELFGGYSFARFVSGGTSTNLNGGMGAFGYNLKAWLQIVGDTSYNFVTISGTKNVLWGNHYGGRVYYRRGLTRWGFTPFAEALVGGSRLDTSAGGVKTSQNCISYKAGGGVDVHFGKRWEVRLVNVDYYRTSFGAGGYTATQNNYWASAGVIIRLFGAPAE